MGYLILMLPIMGISWFVGWRLKSKFKEYAQIPTSSGLSGAEIAKKMLEANGIFDVSITQVEGSLTDHYNPANKTVNLSHDVYNGRSVAAAAVAAHECGHAVQHAEAYGFLKMRSALVPVMSLTSNYIQWILLGGVLMINIFPPLLGIGILLFAITTVFSFITLPVEFDASARALAWLDTAGITIAQEHEQAKNALRWAALTYVVAAIASLATLLYYLNIYLGRR